MTEPASGGEHLGSGPSDDELDPESVPDWPHPVVTAGPDGIEVDGHPLRLPPGVEPMSQTGRQMALRAAVEQYAALDRPIRVRAREADGTGWDLVVTPQGSVIPMGDEPVELPAGTSRRRRRGAKPAARKPATRGQQPETPDKRKGLVAVAIFAVVVLGLGGTLLTLTRSDSSPTATKQHTTSASTPPPANLPVQPPPGFGTDATWTIPLDEESSLALTPHHGVALIGAGGDLEVRDVETGVLRWSSDLPLAASGELHITRIDGNEVLALGEGASLMYWRLGDPEHVTHNVHLPDEAEVSFIGPSPLVTLPDQTAAYVTGDEVRLADVPVGAWAVAVNGTKILAVNKDGELWRLRSEQASEPTPTPLQAPADGARLLRAAELANGMFLVAWRADGKRTVTLYESPGGDVRATKRLIGSSFDDTSLDSDPGPAQADRQVTTADDASVATIGNMVVFPEVPKAYNIPGLTVAAVSGGHLYGSDGANDWLDVTATGKKRLAGETSVPKAVDQFAALVPAEKLDKRLLYALAKPPEDTTTPSATAESHDKATPDSTDKGHDRAKSKSTKKRHRRKPGS